MYTTTVSEIKTYLACPARWYLRYVYPKRSPKRFVNALTSGTIWHQFMESLLGGTEREAALGEMEARFLEAIDALNDCGLIVQGVKLAKDREIMLTAGELWVDHESCETLAIEQPLKLTMPNGVVIDGKPDRVIRMDTNGRIAHFQHKTLGASKPVAPFVATFCRTPHEAVYWAMLYEQYGEMPYGCVLNILRKLSVKTIIASPQSAIQQHLIPISFKQVQAGIDNVIKITDEMQGHITRHIEPRNNPDMDLGAFGNSQDPYFDYFNTGELSLLADDERFTDTVDRYAEADDDAAA